LQQFLDQLKDALSYDDHSILEDDEDYEDDEVDEADDEDDE
jgi:hypothetical protein